MSDAPIHGRGDDSHFADPETESAGLRPESVATPLEDPRLVVELDADRVVNLAQQQCGIPVIKRLALTSRHSSHIESVKVTVEIEDEVADRVEVLIERIPAGATVAVPLPPLELRPSVLRRRTERETTRLVVTVVGIALGEAPDTAAATPVGGPITVRRADPVDILAWNEWGGSGTLIEVLAAFVQPNDPYVAKVLQFARDPLRARVGDDALDGYQSQDPARVMNLVGAIFDGAVRLGIGYVSTAASFEEHGQKVRLPGTIERDRQGNCLDLTLLLAGACEQAGLHPLLVLIEGHIVLGVWTSEQSFPEAVVDVASRVLNRAENREVLLVESTAITHAERADFEAAVQMAHRAVHEKRDSMVALDVHRARRLHFLPLSSRVDDRLDQADVAREPAPNHQRPTRGTRLSLPGVIAPEEARALESPKTRVDAWKNKLLDLTLRNRLLNFRAGKKTLELLVSELGHLEDLLQNDKKFGFAAPPDVLRGVRDLAALRERDGVDVVDQPLREAIDAGTLCAPETAEEIEKRLVGIYREARTFEEESGSNNLFLTLGQLRWFETASSPSERLAPLILLPVRLEKAPRGGCRISLSGEEIRPNITLLQKLRNDYGIDITGLEELPSDDAGVDVPRVLATFRDRIKDMERWEVLERAHLGLFQFSKFVLWRDLDEHMSALAESPVVQVLLDGESPSLGGSHDMPHARAVDLTAPPGRLYLPLDADSSQVAAVQAAAAGRTFVLQGPPGTGKSQTITNLIANSLACGQRVLFVAEKAAALEVVQKRLEKVGLGSACLAIHSHKAGKQEVLEQIRKSLQSETPRPPAAWEQTLRDLTQRRDELNEYVTELHREHACGYSFFRATSTLAGLGKAPCVEIGLTDPLTTDPAELSAVRDAARELAVGAREAHPVTRHPFRGADLESWTPRVETDVVECADATRGAAQALLAARGAITGHGRFLPPHAHGGTEAPGAAALSAEVTLARLLLSCPGTSRQLLEDGAQALETRLTDLVKVAEEERKALGQLESRWRESYRDLDPDEWSARIAKVEGTFFLLRWSRKRSLLKELWEHRKPGKREADLQSIRRDFGRLRDWQRLRRDLQRGAGLVVEHLSAAYDESSSLDAARAGAILDWARTARLSMETLRDDHPGATALRQAFVDHATGEGGALLRSSAVRETLTSFVRSHDEFDARRTTLAEALRLDEDVAFGPSNDERWVERVQSQVDRLQRERHRLRGWAAWIRAANSARSRGLAALVVAIEREEVSADSVVAAVERSLCQQIAEAAFVASPRLRHFSRDDHERRIREFRELDRALLAVTKEMARARCRESIPDLGQASNTGEAGILRRELSKQKRHMPLRRLFSEVPTLLPRIKPCLLMSPISVAQYLSPKWQSDLVIFDEASQIPVPDSIGALGRGRAAIVVGDSKQLPPTAFFAKAIEDDDEDDLESPQDLQSILEECAAAGVPSLHLDWHYRSQHESLIAFSNHHYYDNRLHTFPSALESADGLGVRHVHLPHAVYDKGRSATNRGEAEAIVAEIRRRCATPGATPSIGVVAFSKAQADLIEDLVDEAARADSKLDLVRQREVEPLFIKNLENVQGDERDTIFFSICYGPDGAGKVAMNFGPLNRQGGERRLNVAITRARRELVVFSRLIADEIDLRRTRAIGAEHLKVFLDYAARGPRAITEARSLTPGADFDSPFEKSVYDALVARGHRVDIQVGCSGYRVDLAVQHPESPGRYILGIECDGASYHSAATARDRDRLRQAVLEDLGWRMHRIWSTDYWANPEQEIERAVAAIHAALEADWRSPVSSDPAGGSFGLEAGAASSRSDSGDEQARQPAAALVAESAPEFRTKAEAGEHRTGELTEQKIAGHLAPSASTEPEPNPGEAEAPEEHPPYVACELSWAREDLENGDTRAIARVMAAILEVEAPVEVGYLHQRAMRSFGVARMGNRIKAYLEAAHPQLEAHGFRLELGAFWRADQDPSTWRGIRVPRGDSAFRKPDQIPISELANALEHHLRQAFGADADELMRLAIKTLGTNALGRNVRARMQLGLEHLIEHGRAVADGERVRLP